MFGPLTETEAPSRHAGYYRALAVQADRPLRHAGQREWAERLEAEAGNLAAAVRWYLAHDPALLPHAFRVLWPFWFLGDHINEARVWVDELLAAAPVLGSGNSRARPGITNWNSRSGSGRSFNSCSPRSMNSIA